MNHRKHLFLIHILLGVVLLFVGCQKSIQSEFTPTITNESNNGQYSTVAIPTEVIRKNETSTPLSSGSDLVKTKTLTITHIPTISANELDTQLIELMESNAGCRFPCWWGITPGETSWDSASEYLYSLSSKDTNPLPSQRKASFSIGLSFFVGNDRTIQEYFIKDNIIEWIEIRFGLSLSYTLSGFMETYGIPEEIWIHTYNMAAQGELPLDIILVYPSKGILAYFHSIDAFIADERVQKCYTTETVLVLDLWDPDEYKNFEQISTEAPMFRDMATFDQFQTLGATTDLSLDSFAELFTDPTQSHCLSTPIQFWKNPYD